MFVFVVIAVAATLANGVNQCREIKKGYLNCSYRNFGNIPQLPPGVVKVNLQNNELQAIAKGAFTGLSALQELKLAFNEISAIAKGVFTGLTSLKKLDLESNHITTIAKGAFTGLSALQELNLKWNRMQAIAKGTFSGLTSLTKLNLKFVGIYDIAKGAFSGLTSLQELLLHYNRLKTLDVDLFQGLTSLTKLNLFSNHIRAIAKDTFAGLTSLTELFLHRNQITAIAKGAFTELKSLQKLNLLYNPLVCNCELAAVLSDVIGRNTAISGTCRIKKLSQKKKLLSFVKKAKCECNKGIKKSGAQLIQPDGKGWMNGYCDVATNGEVWTVIQRRQDAKTNFDLGWEDYSRGFGSPSGNFWFGNKNIHRLTESGYTILRVELTDYKGKTAWAEYGKFEVAGEEDNFRLTVGSFSGNAGDSLSYNNGMPFTTKDRDNDQSYLNCAKYYGGAWWHKGCSYSNLNGHYQGQGGNQLTGIKWYHWKKNWSPIKKAEMKVRKPNKKDKSVA